MRDKLISVLKKFRDNIDFENEKKLMGDRLIDSIELVEMIGLIEDEFGIEVPIEEILPENFDNVDNMLKLVEKLKNA